MNLLNTALYWLSQNISVVPLCYRSKFPSSKALIDADFIAPDGHATWLPLKEQLPTEQQIQQWFGNGQKHNLALVTTENLVILDFDTVEEFTQWYCWQVEHNPVVVDTYMVTTSRGLHCYYWIAEPFEPIKVSELYEVRSHGVLTTIPPSIHKSGVSYSAIGSSDNILAVDRIEDVLTFSPLKIDRQVKGQILNPVDPWAVRGNGQSPKKLDLSVFEELRSTDNEGRYYLTHCPFHGRKWNFWLDVQLEIAGCYAGCGQFLFSELAEML